MTVEREPVPRHEIAACQECGRGMCKTRPENYNVCSGCNANLCDPCFNEHECGSRSGRPKHFFRCSKSKMVWV